LVDGALTFLKPVGAADTVLLSLGADLVSRRWKRNVIVFNSAVARWCEHHDNGAAQDVQVEIIQSDLSPTPTIEFTIDASGQIRLTRGAPARSPLSD